MSARSRSSTAPLALGPRSTAWLAAVGIRDRRDLERIGALDAYKLVKAHGYNASLNLLWALQAALLDIHWTQLPAGVKRALRQRLEKS